jgi:hypothetical protein
MPVVVDSRRFHVREKQATMVDEISLAHVLRDNNSFVRNGWAYGQALAHHLLDKGILPGEKPHVVEVGPGPGDLIASAIPVFLEAGKNVHVTLVELSPELAKLQAEKTSEWAGRISHVRGNAEAIGRLVEGCNLVICNEVLADLRVITNIPLERGGKPTGAVAKDPHNQKIWDIAWDMIKKYGLTPPAKKYLQRSKDKSFTINYGAIRFLESLYEMLPPGGAAFISEYFDKHAEPVPLPGHVEYSVSQGHFEKVLSKLGFEWEKGGCNDFLWIGHKKLAVDIAQVNLWLLMGEDPYCGMPQEDATLLSGRQYYHPSIKRALIQMRENPQKHTKLDRALTLDEYQVINEREGWGVPDPQTLPVGANDFTYYMLRKPGPNVALKELHGKK